MNMTNYKAYRILGPDPAASGWTRYPPNQLGRVQFKRRELRPVGNYEQYCESGGMTRSDDPDGGCIYCLSLPKAWAEQYDKVFSKLDRTTFFKRLDELEQFWY